MVGIAGNYPKDFLKKLTKDLEGLSKINPIIPRHRR